MNITANELHQRMVNTFKKMGMSDVHCNTAANVLLAADLRGIDSHGVARLKGYVRLWEKGRVNAQPNMRIVHETPSTATVDGDSGLGLITADYAMDIAIEKAKNVGVGFVAINNSNHFGIAAYHAMKALPHDMIGIALTNASPLVAPTHSKERMLGTNPICYAFPAKKYSPIVIDLATSAAANGKLEIAERAHKNIPNGWVETVHGEASNNPNELKQGGYLLPLGSTPELGSHKGYALAALVDLLCGVVSGANFGPWVPPFVSFLEPSKHPVGKGIGHFVGAMRIDAFREKEAYYNSVDTWIERFKQAERKHPAVAVIIPGEPEQWAYEHRMAHGIEVLDEVLKNL